MARGVVQHLTPEQWREALEQQIREKNEQKEQYRRGGFNEQAVGDEGRPSQSALQQNGDALGLSIPGLERAPTTSSHTADMDNNQIGGRRRLVQAAIPQSREDYLKGLQDQIEEKKRLTQEARDKEQPRCQEAFTKGDFFDRQESVLDIKREGVCKSMGVREASRTDDPTLCVNQRGLVDVPIAPSNQNEDESCKPPLKIEPAADPEAITKLVDFCEELKRQNEDVKKQLLEQHVVLTNLHSTLTIDGDGVSISPASHSRQRHPASRSSITKAHVTSRNAKTGEALKKAQEEKCSREKPKPVMLAPVVPRPRPMRGMSKIPFPSKGSLRTAGAQIISGMDTEEGTRQHSPFSTADIKVSTGTCFNTISLDDKVSPTMRTSSIEEEVLQLSVAEEKVQAENKCIDGVSESKISYMSSESKFDAHGVNLDQDLDERPMEAESKLVHDWDVDSMTGELPNCTSISIFDGPSLLVPLNQSVSNLF